MLHAGGHPSWGSTSTVTATACTGASGRFVLLHIHLWRLVRIAHGVDYEDCRCGKRKAVPTSRYTTGFIDHQWVETGIWTTPRVPDTNNADLHPDRFRSRAVTVLDDDGSDPPTVTVALKLDKETADDLYVLADLEEKTPSEVVRHAIESYLFPRRGNAS